MFFVSSGVLYPVLIVLFFVTIAGLVLLIKKWDNGALPITISILICVGLWILLNINIKSDFFIILYLLILVVGFFMVAVILRVIIKKLIGDSRKRQRKIFVSVFLICSSMAVWNRLYFTITGNYNRTLMLLTPILILTSLAMAYVILTYFKPKLHRLLIHACFLVSIVPLSVGQINNITLSGWIIPIVVTGENSITEDGLFEYRLDVINPGQRNTTFRIYSRNLQTDDVVRIVIDRGKFPGMNRFLLNFRGSPLLETTPARGVYIVSMPVFYSEPPPIFLGRRVTLPPIMWIFEVDLINGIVENPRTETFRPPPPPIPLN